MQAKPSLKVGVHGREQYTLRIKIASSSSTIVLVFQVSYLVFFIFSDLKLSALFGLVLRLRCTRWPVNT